MQHIDVSMLGGLSVRAGERCISDSGSRSKKSWLLLAYLIYQRGRSVSQKKLIDLLWGDDPSVSNPESSLRITLHRLRSLLDGLWDGAGREIIINQDGGYRINDNISMSCDYERFETLCSINCEDQEELLRSRLEAISLYKGDLLEKYSSEIWIISLSTHFRNLYIITIVETAKQLADAGRHREAAEYCRTALSVEPYHEKLVQLLMKSLAAMGDSAAAGAAYENFSSRLFNDFGIHPGEETRAIYRETALAPGERTLMMDEVMEYLRERDTLPGAMQCGYDQFKLMCQVESRSMERSGRIAHIALISISPKADKPMSKRSIDDIAELLSEQVRINLRRGDTFSKCSSSQFIVMLPNANYENSCMVCRRIIAAFHRAHPHLAVELRYIAQPLGPSVSIP